MKPHIFISYASKDRSLACAVHELLNSAGFSVWRDETRLEGDWSREIALALAEQADVLCLLWTQNAAESHWVKHEWLTARALEKRIVACLFSTGPELPTPLMTLHGIQFDDIQTGCKTLVERLNAITSFRVKYEFSALPKNSFIPFNPDPEFTGRNSDLLDLYLKMIGNLCRIGLNQVGTVGMGGVGKTQLAVEFAYRYSFAFDSVFWIDATDPHEVLNRFVSLSRDRLRLQISHPDGPENALQYLFALQGHLKQHSNTLLVLDNVQDPKMLNNEKEFLGAGITPLSLGANLLFTTRRSFDIPGVVSHPVDVLSPETSYDLLTAHRTPQGESERKSAHAIANAVGYLPLAIVLIAGYLRKFNSVTFSAYRQALLESRLANIDLGIISEEELATRHKAAVGATLETQWQIIEGEDPKRILKLAGMFPESAVLPKARLGLLAGIQQPKFALDRPLERAFLALEELSLAESMGDGSGIRLHPLIRDFARGLVPYSYQDTFRRGAAESVAAAYNDPLRLESELCLRGVEDVIGDLHAARLLCDKVPLLADLERLLNRERHPLSQIRVAAPKRTLQQLHWRARVMGLTEMADTFLEAYQLSTAGWALRAFAAKPLEDAALVRVLQGHTHRVMGAGFLDDSRGLSASWDTSLILWDLESGKPLRTFRAHSRVINALAVTPDGQFAASGSDDRTVIVWNLSTGEPVRILKGQKDYVRSVAISADGRHVASVARDGGLVYWDLDRGTKVARSGSFGPELAIRSDGELILCTPPNEGDLLFINPKSKTKWPKRALAVHKLGVTAVAFAYKGSTALTAGWDNKLILWDTDAGTPLSMMDTIAPVYKIAFAEDSRHALTDCGNKLIYWDLQAGKVVRTFRSHAESPNCIALAPNGKLAMSSAHWENTVTLWDVTAPEAPADFKVHEVEVLAIAFDPTIGALTSLDEHGNVIRWDAQQGQVIDTHVIPSWNEYSLKASVNWRAKLVLKSLDTRYLQSMSTGDTLRTFDVSTDLLLHSLTLSTDGNVAYFAVKGRGGSEILVFDVNSGKQASSLSFREYAHFMCPTSDGRRLLIGSDYGLMIVWDLQHDRELVRFKGPGESLTAMCFDSAGNFAATATADNNELSVWDLKTGTALCSLLVSRRVTAIAMSDFNLVFGDDSGHMHFLRMEGSLRD